MARVMGSVPADRWEREVYNQLKQQLPEDWLVIAGVSWSRQGPSDGWSYVRDGQADLVVLAPRLGMVVVEVKGSRQFRIAENGRWYRTDPATGRDVEVQESPPAQASRNMHELEDVVVKKGTWTRFPGLYAYVVVYPQGKLACPPPPLHDSSTLVVQSQMLELEGRLRQALLRRGPAGAGEQFDARTMQAVTRLLTSRPFEITKADTSLELREDTGGIELLTRQQFAALQGIFSHPRVAVTGPAGSGKTVLALWRLQALVEQGKRAMYVCFNKDLAETLRRRHAGLEANIDNVDRLFWRLAKSADLLPQQNRIRQDPGQFFREELPGLVMDAASDWPAGQRYEALIVDEGQDFSDAQLIALLDLLEPEIGTYVFFADWRQDLFRAATSGTIGAEVVFTLHHNCRNTARVNARTNRLLQTQIPSMPGVPEGVDPIALHCTSADAMAARAWQLAHEWGAAGGTVAILSPWTIEKSCMASMRKGHGLQLVDRIEELGRPSTVYFSTIKSFKGIEAASVILVDVEMPDENSGFRHEDLYVACTRATTRLAMLSRSNGVVSWIESPQARRSQVAKKSTGPEVESRR